MKQDPFPVERTSVAVPDLGVGERPISFVIWLVPARARVIPGERIAELLSEGSIFQLEASHEGRLVRRQVQPGDRLTCGQVIATIESEASPSAE